MKNKKTWLCIIALLLLIPAALHAQHFLPADNRALVAKKYGGWSGVLRLWVYEGWQPGAGSAAGWLNRCATAFEKKHDGVYIQPQYVEADALEDFRESGMLPPDMILFPPGLLDTPDGLLPLDINAPLRKPFQTCGGAGESRRAVPVAAGGYLWAYNTALLDGIPGTWADFDGKVAAPEDEDFRQWSAAVLALCAGRYAAESADPSADFSPGLDLGLAQGASTPTPSPTTNVPTLPCAPPRDFEFSDSVFGNFINGEIAAMPVTQREISRLAALAEQGKGPDWRLAWTGESFTDQLLTIAIPDIPGREEQQALCTSFIEYLLSEKCQGELYRAGLFAVTDAPSGYAVGDPLLLMEAALRADGLTVPPLFSDAWRDAAGRAAGEYLRGGEEAPALWERLLREQGTGK